MRPLKDLLPRCLVQFPPSLPDVVNPDLTICFEIDAVKVRQRGRLSGLERRADSEQFLNLGAIPRILIIDHNYP